jgi:membrane protein YqaA with SNARE-associated domain
MDAVPLDDGSAAPALLALFASAFTSATILPGTSEAVLAALLVAMPGLVVPAFVVATLGNTLGGMTSYGIGRLLPASPPRSRALSFASRYGVAALLFSWVPVIGGALCVASGWLRHPWLAATLLMAIGKAARYALVIAGLRAAAG